MNPRAEFDPRAAVLARVRAALGSGMTVPDVPRRYRTTTASGVDVVELFAERVSDYRAVVRRALAAHVATSVADALRAARAGRAVIPDGLPGDWVPSRAVEIVRDEPPLTHAQLDGIDAVVTGCGVAIAETGTIVLDAGAGQGRRALSLLPDVLVCIVQVDQIVGSVPEALARLDPRRPLTWISGPSATSDIELNRIEGVHGPRNLTVVIVS